MFLEIKNLSLFYGAVQALRNIDINIEKNEVVSLLGANGAGKTSILNAISGLSSITNGEIIFNNNNLNKTSPNEIVKLGVAYAPEGRRIFPDLTVSENLDMGAYIINDINVKNENLEKAFHYFPLLKDRQKQLGGTLSGGEQQMLAVARALMSNPTLLMLDEPSLGLAPKIVEKIFEIITLINKDENVTIFLVEQNANEALLHSHRGYVLENGEVTMSGDSKTLRNDNRIIEAYLGG